MRIEFWKTGHRLSGYRSWLCTKVSGKGSRLAWREVQLRVSSRSSDSSLVGRKVSGTGFSPRKLGRHSRSHLWHVTVGHCQTYLESVVLRSLMLKDGYQWNSGSRRSAHLGVGQKVGSAYSGDPRVHFWRYRSTSVIKFLFELLYRSLLGSIEPRHLLKCTMRSTKGTLCRILLGR